jgi:hypothetical protein
MNEEEIKILTKDNEIITLKELFERKEEARKEMANIQFEEKIRILVQLQKIALTWGGKKDVFVWKL